MSGQRKCCPTGTLLVLGLIGALAPAGLRAEEARRPPIRIGLVGSLFRDMPQSMIAAATGPFRALMASQTGLRGEVVPSGDAYALGKQLNSDKLQLGVFHGFEFAWAQKKYPDLRPLMIAVNQSRRLYAHVLVRKDCHVACLGELKGKTIAIHQRSREHCLLFLERACKTTVKEFPKYFSRVTTPDTAEDALDDLVDGVVQAVLVDGVSLDCYKRQKPARFARMKEVEKSCIFPAAVVAYHAGAVDEATLRRFRTGMVNASKSAFGRQLLTLWKITGFETIPSDYQQSLADVVKAYPAPKAKKAAKKLP